MGEGNCAKKGAGQLRHWTGIREDSAVCHNPSRRAGARGGAM